MAILAWRSNPPRTEASLFAYHRVPKDSNARCFIEECGKPAWQEVSIGIVTLLCCRNAYHMLAAKELVTQMYEELNDTQADVVSGDDPQVS